MSRAQEEKVSAKAPSAPASLLAWLLAGTFGMTALAVAPSWESQFRGVKDAVLGLGLGAAVILALIHVLVSRRKLSISALEATLLVLPALTALSMLWSIDPSRSGIAAATALVWILGVMVLSRIEASRRQLVIRVWIASSIVSGLVGLAQSAGISIIDLTDASDRLALTGFAGNPSDLAIGLSLILPLISSSGALSSRRLQSVLIVIVTILIIATQSLSGVLAMAAFFVVLLANSWKSIDGALQRRILVFGGVAVLLVSAALVPRIANLIGQQQHGGWWSVLGSRDDGWTAARTMIAENPTLGVGASAYGCGFVEARLSWLESHAQTGQRGESASHFEWAHNEVLQLISELGAPGALWLLALIASVFLALRSHRSLGLGGIAVSLPFFALHYPTHLALGRVGLLILVAAILADPEDQESKGKTIHPRLRSIAALGAIVLVSFATLQSFNRARVQPRLAALQANLARAIDAGPNGRATAIKIGEGAEALGRAAPRIDRPEIARVAGRAWLVGSSAERARDAFDRVWEQCPHTEALLGRGLARIGTGDRTGGIEDIVAACRLNPKLIEQIAERKLRRMVRQILGIPQPRRRK